MMSLLPDSPGILNRLGNLTALSTSEVLVYPRTYAEPASEAQRSVVSTSTSDTDSGGSGAKVVRIIYLDSNYVLKQEDVTLNGTTPVNTVTSDIRFIERLCVVKGTYAVGAVKLMSTTGGGGSEVAAVPAGNTGTLFAHHYVPAGKQCLVLEWGATVDHDVKLKLLGQDRQDGVNLVDRHLDLQALVGLPANLGAGVLEFDRRFIGMPLEEKTYVRITAVPSSATSTLIRARLTLWEP